MDLVADKALVAHIERDGLAGLHAVQRLALLAQPGDPRRAGDNRAVGLFAAVAQAQAFDSTGIQLQDGRREHVVGDNNGRLAGRRQRLLNVLQMAQGALQNIFDIDIARLQIGSAGVNETLIAV